jgi:hypothetical protein
MWAWHRVQSLLKDADRNDARSQVADEIVRLGEGYSIVTEYTSFIVLENDAEYKRWKIDRRNAVRTTRDRRAHQELAARLEAMRDQATLALGPQAAGAAKSVADSVPTNTAQPDVRWANRPPDLFSPNAPAPTGPIAQAPEAPSPSAQEPSPRPAPQSRGFNLSTPGKGGGAIDPITALIGLALAAFTFGTRRLNSHK